MLFKCCILLKFTDRHNNLSSYMVFNCPKIWAWSVFKCRSPFGTQAKLILEWPKWWKFRVKERHVCRYFHIEHILSFCLRGYVSNSVEEKGIKYIILAGLASDLLQSLCLIFLDSKMKGLYQHVRLPHFIFL